MKVNIINFIWLIIVFTVSSFFNCDNGPTESSAPSVKDDWDAWVVTTDICSAIYPFILYSRSTDKTWSNETESGTQGTITINGTYDYTKYTYTYSYPDIYYEFNNVSITCDIFSMESDEDALIITGSATMNGNIHEDVGSVTSSYSGGWVLNCNFTLDGSYSDEITLKLVFTEDSMMRDYTGTLTTSSGKTFSIKSHT